MQKQCKKCQQWKNIEAFGTNGYRKCADGSRKVQRFAACRECNRRNGPFTTAKGVTNPNPYRVEGDVAYIFLTDKAGQPVAEAAVDAADLTTVLAEGRWKVTQRKTICYVSRGRRIDGRQEQIYLHRFLTACPEGKVVDHINGNGLDNRRANLQIVTHGENNRLARERKHLVIAAEKFGVYAD